MQFVCSSELESSRDAGFCAGMHWDAHGLSMAFAFLQQATAGETTPDFGLVDGWLDWEGLLTVQLLAALHCMRAPTAEAAVNGSAVCQMYSYIRLGH